jgi:hypothetical protein
MIERRTAQRHRDLKQGTLAFKSGGSADCTVRNISSSGARIEIENPLGLPGSFTLVVASAHIMRHCHPVWIDRQQMGVAFD